MSHLILFHWGVDVARFCEGEGQQFLPRREAAPTDAASVLPLKVYKSRKPRPGSFKVLGHTPIKNHCSEKP